MPRGRGPRSRSLLDFRVRQNGHFPIASVSGYAVMTRILLANFPERSLAQAFHPKDPLPQCGQ